MDIASAQWTFEKIGRVNRIDLRLESGVDVDSFPRRLRGGFRPGFSRLAPQVERDRTVTATRAYRVNLNMLALVSLLTGAFLVFSTQSLSVLRRRGSSGLLRALGVTRGQLQLALIGEGAAFGLAGSLAGIALGLAARHLVLHWAAAISATPTAHSGNRRARRGLLRAAPMNLLAIPRDRHRSRHAGRLVAGAQAAAPTAGALAQGGRCRLQRRRRPRLAASGTALLAAGALLTRLPAVGGLPVFGYTAIAALLFGAVLLVPVLWVKILQIAPRIGMAVTDTAVAQLRENIGLSTLSLASVIVSFSLMVAMAIMVYSFRHRSSVGWTNCCPPTCRCANRSAMTPPTGRRRIKRGLPRAAESRDGIPALPAIAARCRARAGHADRAQLDRHRSPMPCRWCEACPSPLLRSAEPAWISEALQDLYGYKLGDTILCRSAAAAGASPSPAVWRDYVRASGAIVITRTAYIGATGDTGVNEGAVWLDRRTHSAAAEAATAPLLRAPRRAEIL